MRRLRIAIATLGRFHVLDLARELRALGHDVSFWSIIPRRHSERFGLPACAHRSLFHLVFPLVAATRYGGPMLAARAELALLETTDHLIAKRLEPCDVFVGMSGLCVKSVRAARDKFGAKIFIERGSRHILSQKAILDELGKTVPGVKGVPEYAVSRELAGYAMADRVVIPSLHVEQSFLEQGFPKDRLFRNAYGVDLSMFPPSGAPDGRPPTILFVGTWSYRKGVDVLEQAWRTLDGVELWHVGPLGDAPLPSAARFRHFDPVPAWRLHEYYSQAHLFVLASREDGFGLVLAQALASGLPLVCTDRTGGEDLRGVLQDPSLIQVVPADDCGRLAAAMATSLSKAVLVRGTRDLLGVHREELSWRAYAARYAQELDRIMGPAINAPMAACQ